jgi:hypothetical protein
MDKKNIKSTAEMLWNLCVACIMIVIWFHIVYGLIDRDYMRALAWASLRMIIQLNEIEEKL